MGAGDCVDIFAADPDLAEGLKPFHGKPPMVGQLVLGRGEWRPAGSPAGWGLLVVSGFLTRRVELAGRRSAELLGQGDVLRPFELDSDPWAMVPSQAAWSVLDPVRLAVLDRRFAEWSGAHPEVVDLLLGRLISRSRTLALRLALIQLPRISARLHFLLWHLADRFGRISPEGVRLSVPLTHTLLADLVSASRPSVSLALKQLREHGLLARTSDQGWLLRGRPPTAAVRM